MVLFHSKTNRGFESRSRLFCVFLCVVLFLDRTMGWLLSQGRHKRFKHFESVEAMYYIGGNTRQNVNYFDFFPRAARPRFDSRQRQGLFFASPLCPLGPTQPPIHWVPGTLSVAVRRPERGADNSPPSSADKNEWSHTSTPQYIFKTWCLVKYRIRLYAVVFIKHKGNFPPV
jgi:hypothetical protein